MTEIVKVYISKKDGKIHTDFTGFQGETCLSEAEKLKQYLKSLGIVTNSEEFTPKTELTQQESEKHVIKH